MVNFNFSLEAHVPLGTVGKFSRPDFPIPFSFFYGELDWTRIVDKDWAKKCVEVNNQIFPGQSSFYEIEASNHNMHMDNPKDLVNKIIIDIFQQDMA